MKFFFDKSCNQGQKPALLQPISIAKPITRILVPIPIGVWVLLSFTLCSTIHVSVGDEISIQFHVAQAQLDNAKK